MRTRFAFAAAVFAAVSAVLAVVGAVATKPEDYDPGAGSGAVSVVFVVAAVLLVLVTVTYVLYALHVAPTWAAGVATALFGVCGLLGAGLLYLPVFGLLLAGLALASGDRLPAVTAEDDERMNRPLPRRES